MIPNFVYRGANGIQVGLLLGDGSFLMKHHGHMHLEVKTTFSFVLFYSHSYMYSGTNLGFYVLPCKEL